MTKENRFKGLMGAVNKDKNVQTSKNLDAQTSSTRKKTTKNIDVEMERGKKASEPTDNDDPPKASDVQTSKNLDVQKSSTQKKASSSTDVERAKNKDATAECDSAVSAVREDETSLTHGVARYVRSDVQTSDNLDNQASEAHILSNISTSKNSNVQTSKAKSTNPDYTRTTLYLPKKMHKRLKAIAVESEREMSQIVEELLDAYLESK